MVCVSDVADVCILSTGQLKINTFIQKDIEVFPGTCVSPTKTQGKKLWFFWLGGYLLVNPIAIGIGTGPNRPMFAGVFKLKKGDSVSEFVHQGV